ncbi:PDZ domain-containing protein [Peribacillus sp. FSL H8-0477]|uniref:PDZ domain-containing protein n=1 Tax=Peribacillus sp. FSL H8-0477 TaxID=2921388 RepID=UPI0030FBB11F
MTEEWLIECLRGIGILFIHPLLYVSIIIALAIGVIRVQRERRDFNIRIYRKSTELRQLLPQGILWGLILSLFTLGTGLVVPPAVLVIVGAVSILLAFTLKMRLLSPAYSVSISFFLLVILYTYGGEIEWPFFDEYFQDIDTAVYPTVAILLGLLLFAEGFLIAKNAIKKPSPGLVISKRGQTVGRYASRRIWMVPLFVFIPGGNLPAPFDWFPVFAIDGQLITPIVIPFLIGFSQKVQGILPETAIKASGRQVILLGTVVLAVAVGGYWYPYMSIISVVIGLIGREGIYYLRKRSDRNLPIYFSRSKLGVRILGVIPETPAQKMGLELGEIVTKVNGIHVTDERKFYKALQKNRAHCKLEVVGNNQQIRYVQRALFEGEHHELGLLFTENQTKETDQVG